MSQLLSSDFLTPLSLQTPLDRQGHLMRRERLFEKFPIERFVDFVNEHISWLFCGCLSWRGLGSESSHTRRRII